jgi:hypothetical protein
MLEKIKNINWQWTMAILAIVTVWSWFGNLWPWLNYLGFVSIIGLAIYLAYRDLGQAILLLVLELIIGSKGYLFYLPIADFNISIRMGLWAVVMIAWLISILVHWSQHRQELLQLYQLKYSKFLLGLGFFAISALIVAVWNKNLPSNIFHDANNWLFALVALPIWMNFKSQENLRAMATTVKRAVIWLLIMTLVLAFVFSHNFGDMSLLLYAWLRDSGLAEITPSPNGFWRIFMQSQWYLVPAILWLVISCQKFDYKKASVKLLIQLSLLVTAMIFSLSRSLWLGLGVGILLLLISNLTKWRQLLTWVQLGLLSVVLAVAMVWTVVNLPILSLGSINYLDTLANRVNVSSEAAVSSRWNLLPPLMKEIKQSPILGQGFGATVIYQSSDPRIVSQTGGQYEAYALEWGWLDLWLKLGLGGLLVMLGFLVVLIKDLWSLKTDPGRWLAVTLIALMVVHAFTPYINHPLGLLAIILAVLYYDRSYGQTELA